MSEHCCAVLGHSPMRFAWGFDEDDETCQKFKMLLVFLLDNLILGRGAPFHTMKFMVVTDPGVGLIASEAINLLRTKIPEVELFCVLPYENVARKWSTFHRERYFSVLEACTHILCPETHKTPTSLLDAYLLAIDQSDFVFAVYDPASARGDAVDQAIQYAHRENKMILLMHPDTFRVSRYQA